MQTPCTCADHSSGFGIQPQSEHQVPFESAIFLSIALTLISANMNNKKPNVIKPIPIYIISFIEYLI